MGSLAAFVDLPEQLRPWAAAGLEHLLAPGGLASPGDATPPAELPSTPKAFASSPALDDADTVSGRTQAPPPWPEPWSTLAARVRGLPRVIITYAALADDVSGNADPARRRLFQSVLAYLAWPPGTTLFWPISFPGGVDPGERFASDYFAQGVAHFGIRHVLCFGEGPARRAKTLFQAEDSRVKVLALPSPEALAGLLPHELHLALAQAKGLALP